MTAISTEAAWRRRFRAPRMSFPGWARDAPDRLLYSANPDGKFELYAWDRARDEHRRVTDRPEGTQTGTLDPSSETIWWFDDERGNEFGRWVVEPFHPGGEGPRLAVPALAPAYSAGLALGSTVVVVGSSVDGGSTVDLIAGEGKPERIYSHRENAYVSGLSRDESLLCITHSEHGDSTHPALRVLGLGSGTRHDLWDGPGLGLRAAGWSPVAGDQRLLAMHERLDAKRPLIWAPQTGEQRDLPFVLPGEVSASWYPDAKALLMIHDHRGRSELYRYDLDSETLTRIETEPGTISAARVRPDGAIWYHWSRSSTAPVIRTLAAPIARDSSGGSGQGATPAPAARATATLRPPGEPAPGGTAYSDAEVDGVHIFIVEPPGPRPHPTVVWVHGGPTAHDRDEFAPRAQAWVDHGLAVVLVNYHGSSGYGRVWRDALQGNPGLTELSDIGKVRDWLVAEGVADEDRVVLAGGSWGGYLTLLGLGTQPDRWSLGVAVVPVADYIAAYEDEMESLKAFDRAIFGGSPDDMPEIYRDRSPLTYIDRVRVPVLILAGENDPRCPIRQIDNYIARLQDLEKPHEVYRYRAGHGSLVTEETIRHSEVMIDFVARHLGTAPPA
ncbi:MAG: S9 family peptidase [Chloroflexi bacterium]|nr:S9 family peptidase [Chloroflexota bacterium]